MDFEEITSLISIREFMSKSLDNPTIPNATASDLSKMLLVLDKKIISLILNDDFKEFLNYKDINKLIQEVRNTTNIKSGMNK